MPKATNFRRRPGCGNDARWKALRAFPPSLEIAARFPHSHSPDYCCTLFTNPIQKGNPRAFSSSPFRLISGLEKGLLSALACSCVDYGEPEHYEAQPGLNLSKRYNIPGLLLTNIPRLLFASDNRYDLARRMASKKCFAFVVMEA